MKYKVRLYVTFSVLELIQMISTSFLPLRDKVSLEQFGIWNVRIHNNLTLGPDYTA